MGHTMSELFEIYLQGGVVASDQIWPVLEERSVVWQICLICKTEFRPNPHWVPTCHLRAEPQVRQGRGRGGDRDSDL